MPDISAIKPDYASGKVGTMAVARDDDVSEVPKDSGKREFQILSGGEFVGSLGGDASKGLEDKARGDHVNSDPAMDEKVARNGGWYGRQQMVGVVADAGG